MPGVSIEQRALWLLHELGHDARHHVAGALRWRGHLDGDRLRAAFARVAARRPIMYSQFPDLDTTIVTPDAPIDFTVGACTDGELAAQLTATMEQPFDIHHGPLLRARVIRCGTDDVLVLVLHPLIGDARSLAIVARELGSEYARPGSLSPIDRSYSDYVRGQRELMASARG